MSESRVVAFIFPHQLFAEHPVLDENPMRVELIEDSLFFGDRHHPLAFHKQKLAYHRATMANYRSRLLARGHDVELTTVDGESDSAIDSLCERAAADGATSIAVADVHDFLLEKRLHRAVTAHGLTLDVRNTPAFLNTAQDNREWRAGRKRWFMADFYQWQRRRLDILMEGDAPRGGKWSFDEDNRKKMPKAEIAALPSMPKVAQHATVRKAMESVERDFSDNPGRLDECLYPVTHAAAAKWLDAFLQERFAKFGPYEDAVVSGERWLYHGVLTPMLNVGLLTPKQVIEEALAHAARHDVPINSVEGFVRQIVGWREFMRASYDDLSVPMRTTNHWNHQRALPGSFWTASTGIDPIDDVIERVLDTGYCHHIERLMLLGGFMFLCEIHPDEVYRWFMAMFIDSYDWVMVPNAYAMSQHADGGAITTKPYFSGSNYVRKMSNWRKGDWMATWDGLFWRWIHVNAASLAGNRRWSMMVRNVERMDATTLQTHLNNADSYLATLDQSR